MFRREKNHSVRLFFISFDRFSGCVQPCLGSDREDKGLPAEESVGTDSFSLHGPFYFSGADNDYPLVRDKQRGIPRRAAGNILDCLAPVP